MACKHAGKKLDLGVECKITNKNCTFLSPDESRCSEEASGIINYLKTIGTYEKVENNPTYTA